MKIDLIRYWKDPDYAAKFDKSVNIESNPAGKLVSDDVLKLQGGGTINNPPGTPQYHCGFSQAIGGGTCNLKYLC